MYLHVLLHVKLYHTTCKKGFFRRIQKLNENLSRNSIFLCSPNRAIEVLQGVA